jgi:transcriptional regulator with XRE-family HTH domain
MLNKPRETARDHHLYTECGLDNVVIRGISFTVDDAGEVVLTIPNINGLHRAIALAIVSRKSGMTGKELRFLRTEMGMTQAQLAVMIHREPLAISRWERGESPIDSNAETLIRLHSVQALALELDASVEEVSGWSIPSAAAGPIEIDGSDPTDYQPLPRAA